MRHLTRPTWIAAWLMTLCLAGGAQANTGDEIRPDRMQSGSLLLRMASGYRVATLMNTDVEIRISGLVARVSVRQEFENTGSEWSEGIYVFPLPDEAAVDRMRLHIGERFIEGEIREKAEARKKYEQAKREGKKASLVEQQRPNLFTTSVANIAPGERVVVEIEYLEDLHYDNGRFSLRFPMTLTPRYMPGSPLPDRQGSGWSSDTTEVADASLISPPMVSSSRAHRATISVDLNAGMALDTITSRYHAVNVSETNGRYAIELASKTVPLDHDFELTWKPTAAASPSAMLFRETIAGDPYYLLMVMPPSQQRVAVAAMPREMIYIIDTSGSMHGTSIGQAKKALLRALDRLNSGDRFNIIAFSSQPNPLFAGTVEAGADNLARARQFIAGLSANGGTEMRAALELALRNPAVETHLRQVVFITDGAVGNEEALFSLIDQRLAGARLFTVGIGSAPNSWFMRKASETGRGTYTLISALGEVGEKMDALFEKIEQPQVTNIHVRWPSGVVAETYPEIVPDLYVHEPVTVRAKISGPLRSGDIVQVDGDTVAGAWTRSLELTGLVDSRGIGALWARARIDALTDAGARGADPKETRDEIVATALTHHLVSKHTSLVAVDKTPVRPVDKSLSSQQVPNLMAYGQSANAIFGFPATGTDATGLLRSGFLSLIVALLLLAISRADSLRRYARGY